MFQFWQNWSLQARMPCPTPKFKLKAPAYQRDNCAGNSKSLKQTECLNSVVDNKSVFVRVTVCEIPLDAVCDTGASVSCLSPKVCIRLPQKIQSSLKPCSKRLLAANQGKIKVKGEVTVEIKIASMTFRHAFFVLEGSEAESLLGPDFLETHKCDPMFSEIKLRLNRNTSANLFHRTALVQSWHYPVMRVVARETSFIPSGHEAIILGKIDIDDHTLLQKAGIFETLQSFCDKRNVLAFNTLFELQEDDIQHVSLIPEKIA